MYNNSDEAIEMFSSVLHIIWKASQVKNALKFL